MLSSVAARPLPVSRRAVSAATSSALPVWEAHRTTTVRAAGASAASAGAAAGSAAVAGRVSGVRENIPARTPLTHSALSGLNGACDGRTGVPTAVAGPERSPARKPER